ncbi:MAG: translation initiation factor IF-2 [Eubacteriales bacterium]|nr:translation initiation factor IF-2 [Eubacteriales bacterium]
MAKTKISELEKMYSADRKEIIAFLNEKGIEAKTASSSVDEEAAAMVARKFGKDAGEKMQSAPAKAGTEQEAGAAAGVKKVETEREKKSVEKDQKTVKETGAAEKQGAPKKKKIIIITNGNQNRSAQSGHTAAYSTGSQQKPRQQQQQQRPQRPAAGAGNGAGRREGARGGENRGGRMAAQTMYHPIKPLSAPSQMDLDYHKPIPRSTQPKPKPAPEETKVRLEKPQNAAQAEVQTGAAQSQGAAQQTAADRTAPVSAAQTNAPAENVRAESAQASQERAAQNQSAPQQTAADQNGAAQSASAAQSTAAAQSAPQGQAQNPVQNQMNQGQNQASAPRREQAPAQAQRAQRPASSGERTQGDRPYRPAGGQGQNRQGQGSSDRGRSGYGQNSYGQGGNRSGGQNRGTGYGQNSQGGYNNRSSQGGYGQGGSRPGQGRGTGYGQNSQGGYNNRGSQGGYGQGGSRPGQGRPGQGAARPGFGDNRNRRTSGPARPGQGADAPFVKDAEKHRDENRRKQGQERDKRSKKDLIYTEDEKSRKNRPGRFIKPEKKAEEPAEEKIKVIALPEKLTIRELAEKMHMQPAEIIKKLFLQGQVMTVNSELTYEEAENIAIDYEIICEKEVKVDVIEELLKEEEDQEENLVSRPPVICVMGHVDHGKTSLLDEIRKTNVTDKEAGGITQHIGAYTVTAGGRVITFLDTPGHEAFTAMRMRGANSTDIAVLVVAADDGVMPQTVEAINHAKAAGIEIIVAVNKMDKPNANIDRVKQELTEYELVATDWGGSTEFVPVSAKTGEGIDTLLETILLTADILELKANPNRKARGLVLEAKLDKGRGPVANVLVQKGTLHVGDFISAGEASGKVRAMVDDKGRRVKEAGPSMPVEILGLSSVPSAGEVIVAHEDDKTAKSYAQTYMTQHKENLIEETRMRMSLDDLFNQMKEGNLKEFDLIIKADVQGSVEALKQSLLKLSNEEVVVKVIHGGVGAINESDVTLASASNAIIIGFNVRPDTTAKAMAEREGVDVRLYKVIYQVIDDVEAALKGMLAPVYEEKVIGHAEVRQIFRASSVGNIAGSFVTDGIFKRGCQIRIRRDGEQIYEGSLASLKRFKDDVKEVREGYECGLVFDGFDKMQELDVVEAYEMVEVPRE